MDYDPYSYEIDENPYPVYRWLRDEAPVYHNEKRGFWALSRFEDVHDALLDWQTYSSAAGTVLELMGSVRRGADGRMELDAPGGSSGGGGMMIFMDPPFQTRNRNLVSKAFTPRRIGALEPRIREIAIGHLSRLERCKRFDAVEEFTGRLPMDVISSLLGIPEQDRDVVRVGSNALLHREPDNPLPPVSSLPAIGRMMTCFAGYLAERRREPRSDMMSALIEAELPDEHGQLQRLSDTEITGFFVLLATAGNETVTKLLASALYWLWKHPEQRASLVERPELIPGAVEELLRFDPPSQYQARTLMSNVTLHGVTLPAGAKVALLNASANRDERKYPEPDRLDVQRKFDLHLGFGLGRHVCLGANLARLEARIALEELLVRFPEYDVDEAGIERIHSSNVRGFGRLPLEIRA